MVRRRGDFRNRWPPKTSNIDIRMPIRQQTEEDALDTLRKFDTVLIVDDSASMQGERWNEVIAVSATLLVFCADYDCRQQMLSRHSQARLEATTRMVSIFISLTASLQAVI